MAVPPHSGEWARPRRVLAEAASLFPNKGAKLEIMSTVTTLPHEFRLDRTQFSVAKLNDPDDQVAYWLTRPVEERLRALELLRRTFYGHTSATARLQKVFEVAQLELR